MKLLEIEISNIRGIRQLSLKPDGKNFVIHGPNGSGKSSIVDAIDFLLTGKISRLTREGTEGINLRTHGPHIDSNPREAKVRGIFAIPGIAKPIVIERSIEHPDNLIFSDEVEDASVYLEYFNRGEVILTRRDILRYITAKGSDRAEQIQNLLKASEVEDVRKTLVTVNNTAAKEYNNSLSQLEKSKKVITQQINAEVFSEETILEAVNNCRSILNGESISELKSELIQHNVNPPIISSENQVINVTIFESDVQNIITFLSVESITNINNKYVELRNFITSIIQDKELFHAYHKAQLLKLGFDLIDDSNTCPLCETSWKKDELVQFISTRIEKSEVASQHFKKAEALSSEIKKLINSSTACVPKIIDVIERLKLTEQLEAINTWYNGVKKFSTELNDLFDSFLKGSYQIEDIALILSPDNILETLTNTLTYIKSQFPQSSPEQNAWDTLTRLHENLKSYESAITDYNTAELSNKRASILLEKFVYSRDKILSDLYNSVKDDFVSFYKQIHSSDEVEFQALLEPDGPKLKFSVDFYQRNFHPPHALHSEGHQDSMGVCLFLALNEYINKDFVNLVILDDVVMSVDSDHRKNLCKLLADNFSDKQFLITTHDKTWANQLRYEGVVSSKSMQELYSWNISLGPNVNNEIELWEKIEESLLKNDVATAAARLRRGLEQFFELICDSLQAKVVYRSSGKWELGDYLFAAMSEYKEIIKLAAKSANHWNNQELIAELAELESIRKQIFQRTNAEQWAINSSVHYNKWHDLTVNDFRPVVDAFRDLCGLFVCNQQNCNSIIYLVFEGRNPSLLRCKCGKTSWNLICN